MSTPTIAVIDDDADLLALLRLLFAEQGWTTLPFTHSTLALDALKKDPPNVIMLDLWLGSTRSGWEIAREVTAHPALGCVPVIICSGATDHLRDKAHWLQEHKIAILPKPFDIDELYAMVETALRDGTKLDSPGSLATAIA